MLKLNEWLPWSTAIPMIDSMLLSNGSGFIHQNWICKYVNARIDMRTGHMILFPGNGEPIKTYWVHKDHLHEKSPHCEAQCVHVAKVPDVRHLTEVNT